ncbi:MAG: methionine--tRNA ligase [Myxococcales bacterium]|nr:MAG: methionine--tRNA ligase [Myxococcales bacterium]
MKPFYITTPIYYVNDKPHLGTTYSTVATDVIARYQRLRGRPTRFLTGLDEHGLKIERRAKEDGLEPQEFVNRMAPPFQEAWDMLDCHYDDFIRTTEARHRKRVQALWKRVDANGDIYLDNYEDWYCVGCERFYTEKELLPDRLCPDHKKPVERIKEESYFFKLSEYTQKLLDFYEAHPNFVKPEGRFNEVKSFVKEGLRDLSISRTSFRWGIPVPANSAHVMYVWFDALTNYISALGAPTEGEEQAPLFDKFWPPKSETIHIVGKDILRFHAVFWPAFLMSAGLEPPTQVWAHGWLTVNGEKMSKSLGNFLSPEPMVAAFGSDVLRYYLMRDVGFGQDGDFSHASLFARYNGELSNGLGNLLQRIVGGIVTNHLNAKVPHVDPSTLQDIDKELIQTAHRCSEQAACHLDAIAPNRALDTIWELVASANRYVDQTAPWTLAKTGDKQRLAEVCYTTMEALRWLSVMIWPIMPNKSSELRAQLGLAPIMPTEDVDLWPNAWGALLAGTQTKGGTALFARIDKDQEKQILRRLGVLDVEAPAKPSTKTSSKKDKKDKAMTEGHISIDDFFKVELRIGEVKEAERIPKSDKLLKLQIDIGESKPRQILAGIGKHYEPEQLIGKKLTIVANLPPRKMMGLESQGMVLAASDAEGLSVLGVDKDLVIGSKVS